MPLMYLKASSVENDVSRRDDRLDAINHESYLQKLRLDGIPYNVTSRTKYAFQKVFHPITNEPALEIETEGEYYPGLPDVHIPRLVNSATMESQGWFSQPG